MLLTLKILFLYFNLLVVVESHKELFKIKKKEYIIIIIRFKGVLKVLENLPNIFLLLFPISLKIIVNDS